MARYKNPWHSPNSLRGDYGPEYYETDAKPTEYKGFLIYHRHPKAWDVVMDDECRTIRAGLNGAKRYIDDFWARENAA